MPGAGKQPPEVQEQIKELLEAGFDPTTIHRRLKVGRSSIYRMKRSLEQHGTNYMPKELNKKNGRPKVLTPAQELEVAAWLRDPKNRTRYLDDLVWLIHDRFGIVCSTTTMSKMKRKWLRVIDYEENGVPIDDTTRAQLQETHPDLPLLQHLPPQQPAQEHHAPVAEMGMGSMVGLDAEGMPLQQSLPSQMDEHHIDQHQQQHQTEQPQHPQMEQPQHHMDPYQPSHPEQNHPYPSVDQSQHPQLDHSHLDNHTQHRSLDQHHPHLDHQLQEQHDLPSSHHHQQQQQQLQQSMNVFHHQQQQPQHDPQIDAQLEQQMRQSDGLGGGQQHHGGQQQQQQHLGV